MARKKATAAAPKKTAKQGATTKKVKAADIVAENQVKASNSREESLLSEQRAKFEARIQQLQQQINEAHDGLNRISDLYTEAEAKIALLTAENEQLKQSGQMTDQQKKDLEAQITQQVLATFRPEDVAIPGKESVKSFVPEMMITENGVKYRFFNNKFGAFGAHKEPEKNTIVSMYNKSNVSTVVREVPIEVRGDSEFKYLVYVAMTTSHAMNQPLA